MFGEELGNTDATSIDVSPNDRRYSNETFDAN